MLLKKLAKLRRAILWCAVFAVSHLAFGANIAADPLGDLGMPDFYSAELGGYRCFSPRGSVDVVTNATTKGKVIREVISDPNFDNLRFSTEPDVGYHLEHWKTYGKYIQSNYQGYFMPTNNIDKASLLIVHQPVIPEPHFVIEPIFLPNTYVISFDPNGGALSEGTSNTKIVTFDSTYGELPTPILANYTFTGWVRKYVDSDEEKKSEPITAKSSVKTAADHELTATWKEYDKYEITVRADDTVEKLYCKYSDEKDSFVISPNTSVNVYENGWIKVWGTTVKEGYSITAKDEASAETIDPVTKNQVLYIRATPNTYSVSFDLSYATLETPPDPITVTYASSYGTLPTPTRVGYNFSGWFLGESRVINTDLVKLAADHALKAHWTKKRYDMSVSISAGKGKIEPTASGTYDFEATIERTAVPAIGYSFAYWEDDREASAVRSITICDTTDNPDANKYSVSFKPNEYTVSFDSNGVNATPSFTSRLYTYDSAYGSLPELSHIEYTFLGWFTDPNGGAKVETTTLFQTAAPVTLYAHWEKLTRYDVTLEKGTGVSEIYYKRNGEDSDWSLYENPVSVISKRTLSAYVVAKNGYTADYTESSPFTSDEIAAASSLTMTATPNTYTVSFNSNGGSVCSSQSVTMDAAYGELPTPTMASAKFMGWYLNDSLITATTIFTSAANVTLVAKWESFNPDLTKAADCVGLMLRSEGNPSYTVGEADGDTYVYLELDGTLDNKATFLISDIEGSGKLSFRWRLQNKGFFSSFEAVADLLVTTNNVESTLRTFENPFNKGVFPTTTWRDEEIELKDVTSVSWRVSSNGAPVCEFYLDNVTWVPAGSEKTELEKWAELLGCAATEDAVAAAKVAFSTDCKLTISFDANGKPIIGVTGVSKELADKVKIECCEDLANPVWIDHDPAQHSDCRFYRGTLAP